MKREGSFNNKLNSQMDDQKTICHQVCCMNHMSSYDKVLLTDAILKDMDSCCRTVFVCHLFSFIYKIARLSDVLISIDNIFQIVFPSCLSDLRPNIVDLHLCITLLVGYYTVIRTIDKKKPFICTYYVNIHHIIFLHLFIILVMYIMCV